MKPPPFPCPGWAGGGDAFYVWAPEDKDWKPTGDGKLCRMRGCRRPAVLQLNRWKWTNQGRKPMWWAYCDQHTYSRVVWDGVVWHPRRLERDPMATETLLEWPTGTLTERRAIFVYEVARMQAAAVDAPIVPEPWSRREQPFKDQFYGVIDMMCGPDRKGSPEELHDDWVKAYEAMGWTYGPERDPEKKTHPDMVPFDQLEHRERIKDAVFVALCEIARQWIEQ